MVIAFFFKSFILRQELSKYRRYYMRNKFSIIAMVACLISFGGAIFAQEANKTPNKNQKPNDVVVKVKEGEKPNFFRFPKDFKMPLRMPQHARNAFELFKYADELQLTDDQIIKLRAYYKKHFSEEAKKREMPPVPKKVDFYSMSEQELLKYADDESARVKKEILNRLQKIIDIKKILTPEQFDKIKKEAENEAERNLKRLEEKLKKGQIPLPGVKPQKPQKDKKKKDFKHSKCPMFPPFGMMMPPYPMQQPMCPQQGMMMHQPCPMQPMCPQPGMMPYSMQPMGFQPHMIPQMPPMPPKKQKFTQPGTIPAMPKKNHKHPRPGMRPHMSHMGPMPYMQPMCPQQGMMMHQPCPMQPMCPQPGMMPYPMQPMGFQPYMMPQMPHRGPKGHDRKFGPKDKCADQPFMFNHIPMMDYRMRPQKEPPFVSFLSKFFGCKNCKDFDIMKKDKKSCGVEKKQTPK